MRGEFAPLRIESDALHQAFKFGLELDQRPAWYDLGHHGARLFSTETRQALQGHIEWLAIDPKQQRGDFVGCYPIDIADEAQSDVIIFGVNPAGAWQAATQAGKCLADLGRNFQSSKQTRHRMTPDASA